jgi:uncharacterized protein
VNCEDIFFENEILMNLILQNTLLTILGAVIGVIGTLIGAGGGFILMPVLLFLYPNDTPDTLTGISLSVAFVNSLSGTIAYIRMKRIDFKYGIIFSLASVPGAVIGAYVTQLVARDVFTLIFAIILIVISIFIFFRSKPDQHPAGNTLINLANGKLATGIIISLFVGLLSSFLGIGGGIIHVPALSGILSFPVHTATATSHFILAITSFTGLMVHVVNGKFQHGLMRAAFLALGALIGAQFGALLSAKVKGKLIIRILSVALFFVGIRFVITFLFK